MEKNHIIICVLLIIIVALISLIIAPSLINNKEKEDIIIYNNTIEDVGTFNTTNVTNFTLDDNYTDQGTHYSANDSITQVAIYHSSRIIENTKNDADRVNDSTEGHTIYKITANKGEHKGEIRYFSVLEDNDKQQYTYIASPDYNLTCMMVDSFKIF